MNDQARRLELEQRLAVWSDASQRNASDLVGGYQDLLARRITNAQLAGLHNVVQAAPSFREIERFIERQRGKATRAGRDDVAAYWEDVVKALKNLRGAAEQMLTEAFKTSSSGASSIITRQDFDDWHCRLAREYVQHLVAHSLWARPAPNRDQARWQHSS